MRIAFGGLGGARSIDSETARQPYYLLAPPSLLFPYRFDFPICLFIFCPERASVNSGVESCSHTYRKKLIDHFPFANSSIQFSAQPRLWSWRLDLERFPFLSSSGLDTSSLLFNSSLLSCKFQYKIDSLSFRDSFATRISLSLSVDNLHSH